MLSSMAFSLVLNMIALTSKKSYPPRQKALFQNEHSDFCIFPLQLAPSLEPSDVGSLFGNAPMHNSRLGLDMDLLQGKAPGAMQLAGGR